MPHNQMQFQNIYKRLGLKLKLCPCSARGFAQVEYRKGKQIIISHSCQGYTVILNRDECPAWVKTEEEFIRLAVERWNSREYTSC